uniref:Uncharacterized protein n=1 Tax=viral metagenome TaxID=1070528 RepID=A0A6C0EDX0_9ZZZZ
MTQNNILNYIINAEYYSKMSLDNTTTICVYKYKWFDDTISLKS